MSNDPQHVEELIAWYALGRLSHGEHLAVIQHLATCAHCRRLAAEAEATAHMLPYTTEPMSPSPQLKRKLMARIDADLASSQTHVAKRSTVVRLRDTLTWLMRIWSPAIALASLTLVLVLGWWNWTLQNESARTQAELAVVANPASHVAKLPPVNAPPGAQAQLHFVPGGAQAVLSVAGVRQLDPANTYEFWLIRGDQAVPAGLFSVGANGTGRLFVQGAEPVENFEQAGVTVEKAGGVSTPTLSALVFVGPIK